MLLCKNSTINIVFSEKFLLKLSTLVRSIKLVQTWDRWAAVSHVFGLQDHQWQPIIIDMLSNRKCDKLCLTNCKSNGFISKQSTEFLIAVRQYFDRNHKHGFRGYPKSIRRFGSLRPAIRQLANIHFFRTTTWLKVKLKKNISKMKISAGSIPTLTQHLLTVIHLSRNDERFELWRDYTSKFAHCSRQMITITHLIFTTQLRFSTSPAVAPFWTSFKYLQSVNFLM